MKFTSAAAAIAVVLAPFLCSAHAENAPPPKPEDAERNAFEGTISKDGKSPPPSSSGKLTGSDGQKSGGNPESRLNDDPGKQPGTVDPNSPR